MCRMNLSWQLTQRFSQSFQLLKQQFVCANNASWEVNSNKLFLVLGNLYEFSMIIIDEKLFVNVIMYSAALMRPLMRLFIQWGSLTLFVLVREILSFYSLRHSLMILSLTFISSKHSSRNYNLYGFKPRMFLQFIIQKVVFTHLFS